MPISRLFKTHEDAQAAAAELAALSFPADGVTIIDNKTYVSAETLGKHGVLRARAAAYAMAVREGAVLLIASAPLGTAATATEVLEKPRAGDSGPVELGFEASVWEEAAPLSSALGIPTLLKNPAPFETVTSIPTLAKKYWFFSDLFGLPLLSRNPAPFSGLIHSPAPLSGLLKLPVLIK